MEKIKLTFPDAPPLEIPRGTSLYEVTKDIPVEAEFRILAAKVDNHLRSLAYVPQEDAQVEFLTYASKMGKEVYWRTANFILYMAVNELYTNTRLVIGHSLGNGFYFDFFLDVPVNQEVLNTVKNKMVEIIDRDTPFLKQIVSREEAIAYFRDRAMSDKVRFLEYADMNEVGIYQNGRFSDLALYPLAYSTGAITKFNLTSYSPGFIMNFPDQENFQIHADVGKNTKLFNIYHESKVWGQILSVNNVGRLNQIIENNGISDLIKVAESLHEKKIANIADAIEKERQNVKLVLIAGPSAAGKTTFSKRLAIHLRVNGIRPITISVDNYFVDRILCPKDEKGEYDFEALEALDLMFFNQTLYDLLDGKEVAIPKFDFETGKRVPNHHFLRLEDDQILIVEGIHCLNERLSEAIRAKNKFKIFVSALTQLSIDDNNRISTTDTRILRRMIRDKSYRGYGPADTIKRFNSVIRGERMHIFPLQESSDFVFNSALVYELAVLKDYAAPLLRAVSELDEAFPEARRLLDFLELFRAVPANEIPPTSILREYIGGSSFKY
ncbi:MAG: nucleoside kinase [Candidatus Omnitrophota bacterium]